MIMGAILSELLLTARYALQQPHGAQESLLECSGHAL